MQQKKAQRAPDGAARSDGPGGLDAMTIRRGSLYAGAFVLAVGAVTAASVAGPFDRSLASDAVGVLWPVTVIAVGVAVLVRRTRAALPAGFVAAAAPGLLLGGALVGVPSFATPCTGSLPHAPAQTQQGSIDGGGVIDLHLACGELRVTAQPGTGWRLDSSDGPDRRTNVTPGLLGSPPHRTVTKAGGLAAGLSCGRRSCPPPPCSTSRPRSMRAGPNSTSVAPP